MAFLDRFRLRRPTPTPVTGPQVGPDAPADGTPVPPDARDAERQAGPDAPTTGPGLAAGDVPEDVVESVVSGVRGGFRTRDEVLEAAHDRAAEVGFDRAVVTAYVDRAWGARLAEQRTWPATTDADRLDDAFAELDAGGVVARMDFTCCQTCGVAEIDDEVRPGQEPVGYVFFHQQDSERLGDDDAVLLLSFGAFGIADADAYEAAALAVGHRVRAALERAGLTVDWPGTTSRRIAVTGLDWRRRLPA